MLVMTHKQGDKVFVGDDLTVEVLECHGGKVKLGFTAPKGMTILRDKVKERDRERSAIQND